MKRKYVKTFEEFINESNAGRFMTVNAFATDALEKKENVHEYGCVMLHLPVDSESWKKVQEMIDEDDIYDEEGYGRENETHVTLLYGTHSNVKDIEIKKKRKNFEELEIILNKISVFENENYDVLKFDIESENLHKYNKELRKLPHTNNFPDYHPHCTIAYLKPSTGKKYIQTLKESIIIKSNKYIYSKIDGSKIEL